MIFWNELIGHVELRKYRQDDQAFIVANIERINGKIDEKKEEASNEKPGSKGKEHPMIYGQFTNWEPRRMFEIREYCDLVNEDKPDIFEMCKKAKILPSTASTIEHLEAEELIKYQEEVKFYYDSYKIVWKDIIQKYMKYKKPSLINAEKKDLIDRQDVPLYLYPTFLRSGKQHFVVRSTDRSTGKCKWYPSECIANFREEEVFTYRKDVKKLQIVRRFIKETSVFAQWKLDDANTIKKCLEHDFKYWKVSKFLKDKLDYNNLAECVKQNFPKLKAIHLYLCAKSNFPSTTMNDFTTYARKAKLHDKNLNQSSIDRLFIATNYEVEQQANNPDKALIRFEFIELLVRISRVKYLQSGASSTYAEAFQQLLDEHIFPNSEFATEWQGFRDEQLYTVDVNDVLQANVDLLKKVYSGYFTLT